MQRQSIEDRFWAKVDRSGECWIWTGGRAGRGYGVLTIGFKTDGSRRMVYAHRLSWQFAHGVEAGEKHVCHTCDNPPCVRPDHLFLGTRSDNMIDARNKGRAVWPIHHGATHPTAKLSDSDVAEIRRLGKLLPSGRGNWRRGEARLTQQGIAERFGVTDSLVGAIIRGEIWTHTITP